MPGSVTDSVTSDGWVVAEPVPSVRDVKVEAAGPVSGVQRAIGSVRESRISVTLALQMLGAVVIIAFAAKWIWFTPPQSIEASIGSGVNALGAQVQVEHNSAPVPPAMVQPGIVELPATLPAPVPTPIILERVVERIVEVPVVEYVVQTIVDRVEVPVEVVVERIVEVERIVVDRGPVPGVAQAVICITTGSHVTAVYLDGRGIPSGCHVLPVALVSEYAVRFTGR